MKPNDFSTSPLYINQILTTIQGEGKNLGNPCILIRTSYCNLICPQCDTKYSWTHPSNGITIDNNNFKDKLNALRHVIDANQIKHLMVTGGEPLLYIKNPLFIKLINESNNWDLVEIETNGTLLDMIIFYRLSSIRDKLEINVSPKLDRLCYPSDFNFEFDIEILSTYQKHFNTTFKFVHYHQNEKDILNFIDKYKLERQNIVIMPLTPDINSFKNINEFFIKFDQRNQNTLKFCIDNALRFTPRIHYSLFRYDKNEFKSIQI
jgi:7-carboxy-7-deazaguanine synthase